MLVVMVRVMRNVSSHQKLGEARNEILDSLKREHGPAEVTDADFNSVLFLVTKFVIICYSSHMKLTQQEKYHFKKRQASKCSHSKM